MYECTLLYMYEATPRVECIRMIFIFWENHHSFAMLLYINTELHYY